MRTAYLIKTDGDHAELVAHGPAVEVKKQFIALALKTHEHALLLGPDIRPKRRGGRQDIDAYLALAAKENEAMRQEAARRAREQEEIAARLAGKPAAARTENPKAAAKADKGKSEEVLRIKREAAKRHAPSRVATEPTTTDSPKTE